MYQNVSEGNSAVYCFTINVENIAIESVGSIVLSKV
jgi:hypothetical protein